jgi:uncharacterized RDD family membrane protein YckC
MMWLAAGGALSPRAQAPGANTPSLVAGAPAPRPRDLLAVAGEDHFWIARVVKDSDNSTTITNIIVRAKWSGNGEWLALSPISERVVSLATANGDLMLVLANGQWEIAADDSDEPDIRAGPTGSHWDEMLAIASDGDNTCAVVRWLSASTQESATTSPTTLASAELESATRPAEAAQRLMLCTLAAGNWTKPQPLPDGVFDEPADLSLEIIDGAPVLAWRIADGSLCVSKLTADHGWTPPEKIATPPGPYDFKLLRINLKGALWIAPAVSPTTRPTTQPTAGDVLAGDDFSHRIPLRLAATQPSNVDQQTLVSAFGNLRWITYSGDHQVEQDYSEDTYPVGLEPAPKMFVAPVAKPAVIALQPWIAGYTALVLLAGLIALRQRTMAEPDNAGDARAVRGGEESKPSLAPLGLRFVAGIVDLAPIIAVFALLHPTNATNPLAGFDKESLADLSWLAVVAYVLHTMIAELICGQSIGKMVFGLRVVNGEVQRPSAMAIILRNLLRVLDVTLALPLLIVLITPLHQRLGDMVAGTVVIARDSEAEEEEEK